MSSEQAFPNSMDTISKHFDRIRSVKSIRGPLSLREALGLSQNEMGLALGHYTGKKGYTRATISLWERVERGQRLPARYAMTERTREAYRLLLADVLDVVSEHRYRLGASMGKRVWHFHLVTSCTRCGNDFVVERWGIHHCKRHRRK